MTVQEVEELTKIYGKAIYSFCCYLTGDTQAADDLYQDILLTALEIREKIESDESDDLNAKYARTKNYLIGIGVRLWKRKKRKWHQLSYELSLDDEENGVSMMLTDGMNVEELVERKDIADDMQRAVTKLPEKIRIVIFMYYTCTMSIDEIASDSSDPLETVVTLKNGQKIDAELRSSGYNVDLGCQWICVVFEEPLVIDQIKMISVNDMEISVP